MFRIPRPRLAAPLTAGLLLTASMVVGVPGAQATAGVTDLETTALRISGSPVTAGGVLPSGVTLTPVQLNTADPSTSLADATNLSIGRPETRVGRPRVVFPAVPAEQVTFRIDGVSVASSVPNFLLVTLQTEQGPLRTAVFTVGGVSYAIPRSGESAAGATRTVATSRVASVTTGISTTEYGLFPVDAQPRSGSVLRIGAYGSRTVATATIYDADNIRGNANAFGEELSFAGPEQEVIATLTLNNGNVVAVRGLRFATPEPYGRENTTWLFDRAGLAAAGATVADVAGVVSFAVVPHDLTWQDLGFDLVSS